MFSKSLRLVTYSLSVDRQMTCCLFPFSIMNFFRLVLRFRTKCIGAKIKTYLMLLFRLITTSYSLEIIGHWHLIFVCLMRSASNQSRLRKLTIFFTIKKGDRRQTFRHAFMNTQYLILLIRSCKLETVLTCLILGSAMEANEAIFCLLRL